MGNKEATTMGMTEPFRIASWGAGTQSTWMITESALGKTERLDAIIFSNTQFERRLTYEIVEFYTKYFEDHGIPVYVPTAGSVEHEGANKHIHIPFFTKKLPRAKKAIPLADPDDDGDYCAADDVILPEDLVNGGPIMRECTRHFKIRPIRRKTREILGFPPSKPPAPPAGAVEQWLGISWDESERISKSPLQYITHRYPLVERRITREDCIEGLRALRLPIPIKSACIVCPYRQPSEWLEMRTTSPDEFARAVAFDEKHRHDKIGGLNAEELYVYKYAAPLAKADFEKDALRERSRDTCESGYCWT
jgi:hypothetical protein